MDKSAKKGIVSLVLALALIALLAFSAAAYGKKSSNGRMRDIGSMGDMNGNMKDMMGGKGMDAMHKQMTVNLDPELRNQMDGMHEACTSSIKNG